MKIARFDKCVFILFDGSRWDIMNNLVAAGRLPNITRHFGGRVLKAVSAFPTVSGPAHLPFMTGRFPGRLDIPGIYWFDRQEYAKPYFTFRKFRSYLGFFKINKMNRDAAPSAKNIFEFFPRHAGVFVWFSRGGGWDANITRFDKALSFVRGFLTKDWLQCDRDAERAVFKSLKKDPDLIFAVFPATDELSHRYNPFSDETISAYLNLDRFIGRLFEKIDGRTLVIVASDHGQSATHTHIDLEGIVARHFKKTMSYKRFATRYFNLDAVVMPSGNGMANVYFRGSRWKGKRPDLTDPKLLCSRVIHDLLQLEGIDILAYRKGERGIVIKSSKGEAEAYIREGGIINYILRGSDPFGWPELPEEMTFEEELALTFDSDYPDALTGLLTLMESRRSGDLIVTSKIGFDLRNWWEYQEPRGSHGSLHREHSIVPVLTNAPIQVKPMRTVDIFPMILSFIGKEIPEGIDGKDSFKNI